MAMNENLGSLLADVSRLMRRSFDERARGLGVTRPQWRVLTVLRRQEGINQGLLAELLEVEPITACRMVDRLQDAGLVERRADPNDRRAWLLFLTSQAKSLLDSLHPEALEMIDEAMTGLAAEERAQLHNLLIRVRTNLSRRTPHMVAVNG
jgi:DNA-binding MarR family transcriptional regulator